ncbi:HD-GYP domain-containing protein [Clostridium sp. DJ247]|uniref:HD-GYP domain-containing protein n=1 Tax=Clostridium sp. DJ247 TaxID=2726188 RepID=UPI0016257E60|nr:HD domain-containing phosphohydrolase [Clostridium sp. DJ247]MBC2579708.1 HD domain-containing protein [Clostridium sp. DJ247]
MNISMDKIIRAISIALDLSQISTTTAVPVIENVTNVNYSAHQFMHHSQRTTYISLEIAKHLNLTDHQLKLLYISALLHDIGATNYLYHIDATNYLYDIHFSDTFIEAHCNLGSSITKSFPYFHDMSNIILNHHENFDGSGPMNLKGSFIPIESQIIRISDLIEVLYSESMPAFKQKFQIISWIKDRSETIFSPLLVEAFTKAASNDMFWFNVENINYMGFILDNIAPKIDMLLDLNQFEDIAYIFSNIIDNKSKFTAAHSIKIGELAYTVSKFLEYPEEKCLQMKVAGLLHDIGKLAIPSTILDKDSSLSKEEFAIIKSHVYYTKIILDRIKDLGNIIDWASNHHEKLDGSGYPRGLNSEQLTEESRIMAVCDIYQALTEDRPYRKGLGNEKAFAIMNNMVSEGFICNTALSYLKDTLYSYKSYS